METVSRSDRYIGPRACVCARRARREAARALYATPGQYREPFGKDRTMPLTEKSMVCRVQACGGRGPCPGMPRHIPYPAQEGMFPCHTQTVYGNQARVSPPLPHGAPVHVYGPCSGRRWHSWPVSISAVLLLPLSVRPRDRAQLRPRDHARTIPREKSNARANP